MTTRPHHEAFLAASTRGHAALLALLALLGAAAGLACDQPGRADPPATTAMDRPGFAIGEADAPVAVVEFSDFGCPYCARFARTTFPSLRDEYIRAGRVRWRYVPVTFGFPGGELMGAAAICAGSLGGDRAFWAAHDLFYARQPALRGPDARPRLLEWIAELGVDPAALDRCIDSPDTRATLDANNRAAGDWHIRGTPTFVINGVPTSGALPVEFFRQILDTALDPSTL